MKCEEMIKEVYFVAGVLEGMTYAKGSLMTEAMESKLADCVDRLELVGAQLISECEPLEIQVVPFADISVPCEEDVIDNEREPTETFGRVYPAPEEASDQ